MTQILSYLDGEPLKKRHKPRKLDLFEDDHGIRDHRRKKMQRKKKQKSLKRSLSAQARWAKAGAREAHSAIIKASEKFKAAHTSPEFKKKRSVIMIAEWQDETSVYNSQEHRAKLSSQKHRAKLSDIMIAQWQDETSVYNSQEYRAQLRAAALGIKVEDLPLFDEGRLARPIPVRPAIVEVPLKPAEYARRVGGSIEFATDAMIKGLDVYPGSTFQRNPHNRLRFHIALGFEADIVAEFPSFRQFSDGERDLVAGTLAARARLLQEGYPEHTLGRVLNNQAGGRGAELHSRFWPYFQDGEEFWGRLYVATIPREDLTWLSTSSSSSTSTEIVLIIIIYCCTYLYIYAYVCVRVAVYKCRCTLCIYVCI